MTWVWEHSWVKGSELLLLLAIADHADDQGRNAWPSVARLADRTRVDRRTIQRLLRRLAQQGCLEIEPTEGPRGTNRYTVVMTPQAGGAAVNNPSQPVDAAAQSVDKAGGGRMPPGGRTALKGWHPGTLGAAPMPPERSSMNPPPNPARQLDLQVSGDQANAVSVSGAATSLNPEAEARIVLTELGPDWSIAPHEADQLVPKVCALLEAGWPRPRLIAVLSARSRGVRSPVAVLHTRLRELTTTSRTSTKGAESPSTSRPPWCGHSTCDERTRMRDDDSGPLRRCTSCHPLHAAPSR